MESLAFLQYTSGISGCRLDVIGDLKFVQKQLLSTRGRNTQYNESIFDLTENTPKLLHLTEIIKEYGKRNCKYLCLIFILDDETHNVQFFSKY